MPKTTPKKPESTVKDKVGIVVMLDALGVKEFSASECHQFLETKEEIQQMIPHYYEQEAGQLIDSIRKLSEPGDHMPTGKPEVIIFGDTIIVCWEGEVLDPIEDSEKVDLRNKFNGAFFTMLIAPVISKVITTCLNRRHPLPLRGSISFGDYIQEDQIVLGEAIADAARWCERARWIGVVVTPSLGARISWWQETNAGIREILPAFFAQYPIPLRNEPPQNLWALSWPCLPMGWDKEYTLSMNGLFFSLAIAQLGVPDAASRIYTNTMDYIGWFRKTYKKKPPGIGE